MEYRDFVYWLQGFFEIANPSVVDLNQIMVIRNHLNMALEYNLNKVGTSVPGSAAQMFASWFDGYSLGKIVFGHVEIETIRSKLNDVFVHEIDPSMPDKDGKLQLIHDNIEKNKKMSEMVKQEKDKLKKHGVVPSHNSDIVYRC